MGLNFNKEKKSLYNYGHETGSLTTVFEINKILKKQFLLKFSNSLFKRQDINFLLLRKPFYKKKFSWHIFIHHFQEYFFMLVKTSRHFELLCTHFSKGCNFSSYSLHMTFFLMQGVSY